jgi:predicted dehydrogenase
MIGHNLRFVDAIEKIKTSLERGHIGSLETATIEEIVNGPFSHPINPVPVAEWWLNPQKSGGGALIDIGYHMIDLFRFFTGEDANVLFSSLRYKYNLPVEEGAVVVLSTRESSVKGIINVGWYQRSVFPKYNFRAILHGNSGYLSTEDFFPRNIYIHAFKAGSKNIFRRITGQTLKPLSYTYYYEAYYKELRTFFDCLENDLEPPVSALDGLKTMQIIAEAYRLFNNGKSD